MTVLLSIALVASLLGQSANSAQELAAELADKLAARITPSDPITLNVIAVDETAGSSELRDALVTALRARNIRAGDAPDRPTRVDVSCGANLRERTCLAEIRKGTARDVIAVSRPHTAAAENSRTIPLSLEWRPVFAQRGQILDIALAGDRLLVLEPQAVVSYQRRDASWQRAQTRPIPSARTWPRDLRGRLWIDGPGVEVRLPGVSCRAPLDLANVSCADERRPWPIGIENAGLDATRNNFTTPEGLPFFAAASLGASGEIRWLIADRSGLLTLLDGARSAVATVGPGDDVVAIAAPCTSAPYVLVASASDRQRDTDHVRLWRLDGNRLAAAGAPVDIGAAVTALWAADATTATAVVRDASGERYEAVHIRIACDR